MEGGKDSPFALRAWECELNQRVIAESMSDRDKHAEQLIVIEPAQLTAAPHDLSRIDQLNQVPSCDAIPK